MRAKEKDDVLNEIANNPRYGLAGKVLLEQLAEDPLFCDRVIIVPAGTQGYNTDENRRFFDILHRRVHADLLAPTLKKVTRAMGGVLDLRPIEPDQTADRAPTNEPGLFPSAMAFISACRSNAPLTQVLEISTEEISVLTFKIWVGQQVETVVVGFTTLLQSNLGVWESALLNRLRSGFNLLDPLSNRNPDLFEELAPARRYLRGPAATAAQKRKDNKKTFESISSKATATGMAEAEKKASSFFKDRIGQMLSSVIPGMGVDNDNTTTTSQQDNDTPQKAASSRRRRDR